MTEVDSGWTPGERPGESKEQRRRAVEDVILAFRPDVRAEFEGLITRPVPSRPQALEELAQVDVPRLLKHRLLIDSVRRLRGEPPRDEPIDEAVRSVLGSTLQGDPTSLVGRTEEAKGYLDEVAREDGPPRLRTDHWNNWVRRTDHLFKFNTHERTFQACNDEQIASKPIPSYQRLVDSRLIVAEFWSDYPPTAFREYIDPANWPNCSDFWTAMREEPPGNKTPTATGYDCDYAETVDILDQELTVPLRVAVRARPDGSRVWTRFNIGRHDYGPLVPVDVDTGTVSAETLPGGPAPTLVRATKYLHWSDPDRPDLTGLACEFGWSELMVEMANACRSQFPAMATMTPAQPADASIDAATRRLVEDVGTEVRAGIGEYAPLLETFIRRFTGPSWDVRWINDLFDMGRVTVRRSGQVARHVRTFADALRDVDDKEAGHG